MPMIVSNGLFDLKQRIDLIKKALAVSNIDLVNDYRLDNGFHLFNIMLDGKSFSLSILLKNIVNSGWTNKPLVKRIQVKSFGMNELNKNTPTGCSMFLGIGSVDEKPIFACWNPFMFVYHKTMRSCYVDVALMGRCSVEGFIKTTSSGQKVLLSDIGHFRELLLYYIKQNTVGSL